MTCSRSKLHCQIPFDANVRLSCLCAFQMNENVIGCVQLAAECLPGLAYNLHLPFIDEVIEMCSNT